MSFITRWYYNWITVVLYRISAVWIGTFMWLFLSSLVIWLIYLVFNKLISYQINTKLLSISLFSFSILLSTYGVINSFTPKVTNVSVPIKNLPTYWQGKQIVFVADTHFGQVRTPKQAKTIANLISKQKPELVLIAGDFYDGPKTDFISPAKIFGEIPSTYGTYFVTGNHEEYSDQVSYKQGINFSKVINIGDKLVNINGIQLLGLAYETNHTAEQIQTNIQNLKINDAEPSILIKHVPLHVDIPAKNGIDLQLYGHSHNGQVVPNNLIAKWIFKGYNYGLKLAGESLVYTTSGVGTWGPPQRIGTKAEIVVITLENK